MLLSWLWYCSVVTQLLPLGKMARGLGELSVLFLTTACESTMTSKQKVEEGYVSGHHYGSHIMRRLCRVWFVLGTPAFLCFVVSGGGKEEADGEVERTSFFFNIIFRKKIVWTKNQWLQIRQPLTTLTHRLELQRAAGEYKGPTSTVPATYKSVWPGCTTQVSFLRKPLGCALISQWY